MNAHRSRSQSPNGKPEEHPGDNPEIIEKQKSQPMDENGEPSKHPEDDKMHRKESMDDRRRSRSNSS